MAGKLSEMSPAAALTGTERIESLQSGDNLYTTPDAIRNRAIASLASLTAAGTLAGTEALGVAVAGAARYTTLSAVRDYATTSNGSLTAASALTGTEIVSINQGGAIRRVTAQEIADLAPGGGTVAAEDVTYDNTASGPAALQLDATDAQAAIDEVVARIPDLSSRSWSEHDLRSSFVGLFSDFTGATSSATVADDPQGSRTLTVSTNTSTANSGANTSPGRPVPGANPWAIGPLASYRMSACLISDPSPSEVTDITAGFSNSVNQTIPTEFFGLEKLLAGGWQITIRKAGSDIVTPVSITMPDIALVITKYTVNSLQTGFTAISVRVYSWPDLAVLGSVAWTGSDTSGWANIRPSIRAYRPTATGSVAKILRVSYFGQGFAPPEPISVLAAGMA